MGSGPGAPQLRHVRRDLLVGNFGNGTINVYNPTNGARLGQLRRHNGLPIVIDGLWGLRFGNGNAAKTNELIFSAGPNGESHGLLGKIVVNPDPSLTRTAAGTGTPAAVRHAGAISGR